MPGNPPPVHQQDDGLLLQLQFYSSNRVNLGNILKCGHQFRIPGEEEEEDDKHCPRTHPSGKCIFSVGS